jgi:methyl-accepting chemotaxis protein
MNFLSGLRIQGRLYGGFGLLVVFVLALAGFAAWRMSAIESQVGKMTTVSQNALRISEVSVHFQAIRRALLRHYFDGDEPSIKEAVERETKAGELLQVAAQTTLSEERRKLYNGLAADVGQLRAKREALVDAVKKLKVARTELFGVGDKLAADVEKFVEASRSAERSVAQGATDLEADVLLVRVANWRFLATHDPKGTATFHNNVSKAQQQIAALEKADLPQAMRPLLGSLKTSLAGYAAAFEAASASIQIANDLYFNDVLKLTAGSLEIIGAAESSMRQDYDATRTLTDSTISNTITMQVIVAGLAFLLAGLIAFVIARGISTPLSQLTAAMKVLAGGNFDVVLPGLGRKDEIGDIAGAVEEFKEKAAEKAALEADEVLKRQKADAEAQARAAKAEMEAQARANEERAKAAEAKAKADAEAQARLDEERAKAAEVQAKAAKAEAEAQARANEERAKAAEVQARVVGALAEGLKTLSDGNLTYRLTDFPEEYLQIRDDFNTAMTRLQETVQAIALAAGEVASASSEISSGTTDLSQRTEEQAASLEETSASMEEISATVKKNAENAQQAKQFADGTRTLADRGGAVVTEAVSAMARIEESSGKIADIISLIDEIARQTNLLALNAAVEAARAGEAGRGFAVVASEVRSLAQRSSQAAKDIKDLITNSSGQVREGVQLVNKAGGSLTEILDSIKKVAEIVAEIAAGSAEQASGINQVNVALTQMDEVTQQNSALVEQNAAAAKALEEQSQAMDRQVAFFKLGDGHSGRQGQATSKRPAAAAPAKPRSAPVKSVAQPKRGMVARMQGALATAFKQDADIAEF